MDDRSSPRTWGCFPAAPHHRHGGGSSPRTWGCFSPAGQQAPARDVFPTHVGVFLTDWIDAAAAASLPHARGGVSCMSASAKRGARSSPRTWGCFFWLLARSGAALVFPTHVGVFLSSGCSRSVQRRLPHARGGVSPCIQVIASRVPSSPRTWGCFFTKGCRRLGRGVFPTHVGVFPTSAAHSRACLGLPHARGGVSASQTASASSQVSSPRTWGCFLALADAGSQHSVFPTHVGVFRRYHVPCPHCDVFPTHVGVFLSRSKTDDSDSCLPHARGGVSSDGMAHTQPAQSSPRTWGCFYPAAPPRRASRVFPTHVGVFPLYLGSQSSPVRLPHARGGVSR